MKKNNFDFLRFYLAFIVLLTHIIVLSEKQELEPYLKYLNSYLSVTAFFVISGYLIAKSYINSPSLKIYLKKRAARLLPAYIFVIITCSVGLYFLSNKSFYDYFTSTQLFKYLLANLTFQNYLQPYLPGVFTEHCGTNAVNGALWTLKIEVAFYLLLPLIIYFSNKVKNKILFFSLIYFLSVLYKIGCVYLGQVFDLEILSFISHQLPGFLSYFICGVALVYLQDIYLKNKNKLFVVGLVILLIERQIDIEFLTPIALSSIIFFVSFSLKKLNNFAKYGDISYGMYIYHFPIINIAVELELFKHTNTITAVLLIISCVFIVSFSSWHILEKRFLSKVRRL